MTCPGYTLPLALCQLEKAPDSGGELFQSKMFLAWLRSSESDGHDFCFI